MSAFFSLTGRGVRTFLRDRASVFFSLLGVFIIIGLYALFLGQFAADNIVATMGDAPGVRTLVDSWIVAGILVVSSTTVTLGVMGSMITDRSSGIMGSFLVTPAGRGAVTLSYLMTSWIVGTVLTWLAFVLGELYILSSGGGLLPPLDILKALGLIVLNVISSSTMMFFFATIITSMNGFSALSSIVGTLIGFITGIYIPIGVLPEFIQSVMKFVPQSHGAALMRQVFTAGPLERTFAGAPADVLSEYKEMQGIVLFWNGQEIEGWFMLGVLVLSAVVFAVLSAVTLSRKGKGR